MRGCLIGIIVGLGSLIIDSTLLSNLNTLESICAVLVITMIWGCFGFIVDCIIEIIQK